MMGTMTESRELTDERAAPATLTAFVKAKKEKMGHYLKNV